MTDDRDDLSAARGIIVGVLIAIPFWVALIAALP